MTRLSTQKNRVYLAVAGAGKTTKIVQQCIESHCQKKIAILTYTHKAVQSVIDKLQQESTYGIPSVNLKVYTWYNFLYHECVLPYQKVNFCYADMKGLSFDDFYGSQSPFKKTDYRRYCDSKNRLRAKYAADYIVETIKKDKSLIHRLEQIFEEIIVDEVQDLAGEDLDFIELLLDSKIRITLVGDSRQATFVTHTTRRNKRYKGIRIIEYFKYLEKIGKLQLRSWRECYRSNQSICVFADKLFPSLPPAISKMDIQTGHDGVFLIPRSHLEDYISFLRSLGNNYEILRYDKNTKTESYRAYNFGECKGLTFERVIIFPNGPLKKFLADVTCQTPAKYYVGLTRARFSVAIIVDSFPTNDVYQDIQIQSGSINFSAKQFCYKKDKSRVDQN